jgi:hypothetical protein
MRCRSPAWSWGNWSSDPHLELHICFPGRHAPQSSSPFSHQGADTIRSDIRRLLNSHWLTLRIRRSCVDSRNRIKRRWAAHRALAEEPGDCPCHGMRSSSTAHSRDPVQLLATCGGHDQRTVTYNVRRVRTIPGSDQEERSPWTGSTYVTSG